MAEEVTIRFNVENAEAIKRLDLGAKATKEYEKSLKTLEKEAQKGVKSISEHADEVAKVEEVYTGITSNLGALASATKEQQADIEKASESYKNGSLSLDEFKASIEALNEEMLKNSGGNAEILKAGEELKAVNNGIKEGVGSVIDALALAEKATSSYSAEVKMLTKAKESGKISEEMYAAELEKTEKIYEATNANVSALTVANNEQLASYESLIEGYRDGTISLDEFKTGTSELSDEMLKNGSASEDLGEDMDKLEKKTKKTKMSFNDFSKGVISATKDLFTGKTGIVEYASSMGKMLMSLNPVTLGITAVTAVIVGNAKAAWDSVKAINDYTNQLNVMTGDSSVSVDAINRLSQSLVSNTLGAEVAREAMLDFVNAGMDVEDVIPHLNAMGDLAKGNTESFKKLNSVYITMINTGVVGFKELNAMQKEGVPVLDELAEMYGVNRHEIEDMVNKGLIGMEELDQALGNIITTNEDFAGSLATANANFAGTMGEIKDVWNQIIGNVAMFFMPLMQGLAGSSLDWLRNMERLSISFGKVGEELGKVAQSEAFLAIKYLFEVTFSAVGGIISDVVGYLSDLGKGMIKAGGDTRLLNDTINLLVRTFELLVDVAKISITTVVDIFATEAKRGMDIARGWGDVIAGVFTFDWDRIQKGVKNGNDAIVRRSGEMAGIIKNAIGGIKDAWDKATMPDDFRSKFNRYVREQTMDMEQALQVFRDNEAISAQSHADLLVAIETGKTDLMLAELERLKKAGEIQLTEYEEILKRINAMKSSDTAFTGAKVTNAVDPQADVGNTAAVDKKLAELRKKVIAALGELKEEGRITTEEYGSMVEKVATQTKDGMLKMFESLYKQKELGRKEYIKVLEAMGEDTKHLLNDWYAFSESLLKLTAQTFAEIGRLSSGFKKLEIEALDHQLKKEKELREKAKDDETELIKQKYEDGILNELEYNRQLEGLKKDHEEENAKIEQEGKDRLNELKKKEFETNKAFTISSIWLNLASAIMGIVSGATRLGPVAGPVFAGIQMGAATGLAGAQTALAAKQEFIPAARLGGMVSKGGIVSVGEEGQEFIDMPAGVRVTPLSALPAMTNNTESKETNIVVNMVLNGVNNVEEIADRLSEELGRRIKRGEL